MTEQNQNVLNEEYDVKMILKYAGQIKDGNLQIGNYFGGGDPEVTNLRFLEKFDIQTLKIYISSDMSVQLRSSLLKELSIFNEREYDQDEKQTQRLNMQIDDLELENLEVLDLHNSVKNDQLYNLAKFKKLHTLDVSFNNVDLTHIHIAKSLTKLTMVSCGLKNINLISSLVNLEELDISLNEDLDLSPLYKIDSLTKLSVCSCGLKNIHQIVQLTNLEVLDISSNKLQTIDSIGQLVNLKELDISGNKKLDINPLKNLVGLIKLDMRNCALTQLSALQPLFNLQTLDLSYNPNIIITELKYLKKLKHLNLASCNFVSVYVLRPLMNLEELDISDNKILYLDAAFNQMTKLEKLIAEKNRISDFSQLEQHPNYNIINENGCRCFEISNQEDPSQAELYLANHFRSIERPNLKLKEIQVSYRTFETALNNFKKQINSVINSYNHIQFTSSVAHLFEKLTQTISQ
ncbi:receptor-like_protein [Hexamita inflata]|uniref:Receptor-like protein n=1 Tax=Hexamita inflata TaxID=28002 RepID=A0AA86U4N1_9EUKA|nr:receptor-like protein [Hexamita inflata]